MKTNGDASSERFRLLTKEQACALARQPAPASLCNRNLLR